MYLEGSDQHRGWFHSSLLVSVGERRARPRTSSVLTHGFVVDGKGRKMSKTTGNVIPRRRSSTKFGAEILRLWVTYEDYRDDIRISKEIIDRIVETYRRIRNTFRFLHANIDEDFDPAKDSGGLRSALLSRQVAPFETPGAHREGERAPTRPTPSTRSTTVSTTSAPSISAPFTSTSSRTGCTWKRRTP